MNGRENEMKTSDVGNQEENHQQLHAQSHHVLKRLPAMGPVIMLYMQSSHRRFQFISDLEWLLLPPLVNGQCKLYMKKEYPVSFVSWAFMSESAEKKLFKNGGKLRPEDWRSGDRLWIVDIVAPFGGVENMLHDIRRSEFPDQEIRLVVPEPKTGGVTARKFPSIGSEKKKNH